MIERAKEMFDEVGHGLGEFFRLMCDKQLIDLKTREGKSGGGFCTSFPKYGVPFVFANFNGTDHDARVFTHEMGHAFQNYSSRNQKLLDYIWPTFESAEIHSMSLEFITWPWMEKFFEEDAARFRRSHLIGALTFLPYGTAVDHFQHLVYEQPDATPDQRREMWREMEKTYLPWRDMGGLPHVSDGGYWQAQRHIYGSAVLLHRLRAGADLRIAVLGESRRRPRSRHEGLLSPMRQRRRSPLPGTRKGSRPNQPIYGRLPEHSAGEVA